MDQEKIGKFIAKCRKQKKLTQQVLAEKLGVTDRAVSKWETGKSMPDLSLFNSLCLELGITINELLAGEKIEKKNYQAKLEQNLVKAIDYSVKKNNKKSLLIELFLLLFGSVMIITAMSIVPNSVGFIPWYLIIETFILIMIFGILLRYLVKKDFSYYLYIALIMGFFAIFWLLAYGLDFLNVKINKEIPVFNKIVHRDDNTIFCDSYLYDVFFCGNNTDNKYMVITKNIKEEISPKVIDKYCNYK